MNNTFPPLNLQQLKYELNNTLDLITLTNNINNVITGAPFKTGNNVVISKRGNTKNYYHYDSFVSTMQSMGYKDPFTRQVVKKDNISVAKVKGEDSKIEMQLVQDFELVAKDQIYSIYEDGRIKSIIVNQSDVKVIPSKVFELKELKHLRLEKCINISQIPNSISKLKNLEHLDLYYCIGLKKIHSNIGNLIRLKSLSLYNCENIKSLPSSLNNLSNLEHINYERSGLTDEYMKKNFPRFYKGYNRNFD